MRLYREEDERGGKPYFLAENGIAESLAINGSNIFLLGRTGEEMARNLYAQLRRAEQEATLLIGIEPTLRGGVMAGVLNRLMRAFGIGAPEERK